MSFEHKFANICADLRVCLVCNEHVPKGFGVYRQGGIFTCDDSSCWDVYMQCAKDRSRSSRGKGRSTKNIIAAIMEHRKEQIEAQSTL